HPGNGAAVVVRREEDTQTRGFAARPGRHMKSLQTIARNTRNARPHERTESPQSTPPTARHSTQKPQNSQNKTGFLCGFREFCVDRRGEGYQFGAQTFSPAARAASRSWRSYTTMPARSEPSDRAVARWIESSVRSAGCS